MLGISAAVALAVVLSFALGAGLAVLYLTRQSAPQWPLVPCDSSGKTAMDYLFEIVAEAQACNAPDAERIRTLARNCMRHVAAHYRPPEAYPQDSHCECLHKALSGAQCGNWSLVIDELDHDG